ncbi:MAG: long-chain fatty acid--CoA ligase [Candidatus Acetothermia bacterium]|nr:long-chain fatty acid--CoA ligase [Candidatus Acetothermia bacterium]MDH7504708.1 long-chain fatty acid--CoA ligase [Candidatus Acetothermia bacterium]
MEKLWLASYPKQVPHSLVYPRLSLSQLLGETARRFPANPAIIYFGQRISYRRFAELTEACAAALHELGVRKGDRVSINLPNIPQFVIAFYATLQLGAIVVQTNPMYTERELVELVQDSGAETMITLDAFYAKAAGVRAKTGLKRLVLTSVADFLPRVKRALYPLKQRLEGKQIKLPEKDFYSLKDLLRHYRGRRPPEVEIDPEEDVALLQYTGGTTGVPKGAMLTHKNLIANALQSRAWFLQAEEGRERVLAVLPFFHVYGMTVAMNLAVALGGALILLPRFRIDEVLEAINKYQPTIFPGAPTMYVAFNTHPHIKRYKVSSIKECISGSAPLPVEVKKRFEQLTGGRLVEGYGLSEASPVTHSNPLDGRDIAGSIGLPFPDTEAKIVDPVTGEDLPIGQVGELVVRGPQVMKGYWNKPEETAHALKGGWLHTGDIARMDDRGYFYIVDRAKDMIIASGYNVYPREVEEVLYQHPQVAEVAVIGVPDPYRGETVKAFIVPRAGEELNEEEITSFCRERLAAYKIPRLIEFRDSLPKSAVGKVLKRELRQQELQKAQGQT